MGKPNIDRARKIRAAAANVDNLREKLDKARKDLATARLKLKQVRKG